MNRKQFVVGILTAACLIGAALILPGVGQAQDAKVKTAMDILKSMAEKMGPPKIEGSDTVAGKQVPAIYFGSTKMNNNFDLVDEVVKQAGGTATIFVKSGDEYVRVATNVKKDDGSRAIGTILDPKGKAIESIEERSTPIRLTHTPTRCRVLPVAGIKLGIGRRLCVASDAEQRTEGVERVEAPVEPKREFVEVGL